MSISSSSPIIQPSTSTSNPLSSPSFLPILTGNLTAKGIDTANTTFQTSNLRTLVPDLPFPHPKWHVRPSTGEIYEVVSPIFEEYDPVSGYVDSVGPIAESMEVDERGRVEVEIEEIREDRKEGAVGSKEGWVYNSESEKRWTGRVEWPESRLRSSIAREAKRVRDERGGQHEVGMRRSKRLRERH